MTIEDVSRRGLFLLGCGKMGSAMLAGWLGNGMPKSSVHVIDPFPSDWLKDQDVNLNLGVPDAPGVALLAVKPQMMGDALPSVAALGGGETLILSVAAGTPISVYEATFGENTPIIRAMPNSPAAIGKGITAIVGNQAATESHLQLAKTLLSAIGQVVRLDHEDQMDAVTGVSGSGPAYVFHMIETLAAAGEAQGLAPDLAMTLAKATVAGAGALAEVADETPSQLRVNVTSPAGTTEAGLKILMNPSDGLPELMKETVKAASDRSRELRG